MFKFLHSPGLAKAAGWIGSTLLTLGGLGILGQWSAIAVAVGGILTGTGVHIASNTSTVSPLFVTPKQKP